MTMAADTQATAADAYARVDEVGQRWTIGTNAVELGLIFQDGHIRLCSCLNKLFDPPGEMLDASAAQLPLFDLNPIVTSGPGENVTAVAVAGAWKVTDATPRQTASGGRPVAELVITMARGDLRAALHFTAFPRTPIIRFSIELQNNGAHTISLDPVCHHLFAAVLRDDAEAPLTHYWLGGDNPPPESGVQGMLYSGAVGAPYYQTIAGDLAAAQFTPWTGLLRTGGTTDGMFVALEYLGTWAMHVYREEPGPVHVKARIPDIDADFSLAAGESVPLPTVTIGMFRDDLDDMGGRVYDWQYEYLWDYTNDEYYALPLSTTPWWGDSTNLQENFAGRLALDLKWPDMMREAGMQILWDDAGWSETAAPLDDWRDGGYGGIWKSTQQGPDFSRTLRYLDKCGMKWVLWFNGNYSSGLMASKAGAWGNFQWRTDDLGTFDLKGDPDIRERVTGFLREYPRCSFQTCSGGGSVAHMFDMQNIAGNNYFTDYSPRNDRANYYFSYLDPPDKWSDIITSLKAFWLQDEGFDMDEMSPNLLTMTPAWFGSNTGSTAMLAKHTDLYRYLLREGVAGRWSRVLHARGDGDEAYYYFQRLSYCRTRGLIIPKHKAPGAIVVYPRGLIADHTYEVGFASDREAEARSGADLMDKGIPIDEPVAGELVFLGLPDRPGSGTDIIAPQPPGTVYQRGETNIGRSGVGIYWSPGTDNNWVMGYEVRRGDETIGVVRIGTYFFDHDLGFDATAGYAVRTVDGDGNVSDWCTAQRLADEPRVADALSAHGPDNDRWRAESSTDGSQFKRMTWIPPARFPTADWGGTARQPGGVEGYWQAAETARVGRGWQQAAAAAQCVRTWVVPESGRIRMVGRAMKEYYRRGEGKALRVRILHNQQTIWPANGWADAPLNDLSGATHDLTLDVEEGDAIRFVLDASDDPENDIIAWMPRVTMLDETPTAAASEPTTAVVRVNCGAPEQAVDHQGNCWSADRFFSGGEGFASTGVPPVAADEELYVCWRAGDEFTYSIPVAPGLYALRLKFAECEHEWSFLRPFDLDINGRSVLRNFDVCWIARGPLRTVERVFRYLVPDADGNLVLRFRGGWEPLPETKSEAMIQAIEVVPEDKTALRIDAGATAPYIDWNSFVWESDTFCDGDVIQADGPVDQASPALYDQALYQTARTGKILRYALPASPGLYTVHLKFAEMWLAEIGQRPMHIDINGARFKKNWDPAAAAGRTGMAIDLRAENITPDSDGRIAVVISAAGEHDAIVQALEIG